MISKFRTAGGQIRD